MRIRVNAEHVPDDEAARIISERIAELMANENTPTFAFLWDHQAEMWLGAVMWEAHEGVNFELDQDLAATLTALFTTLRMMSKGIEVVE